MGTNRVPYINFPIELKYTPIKNEYQYKEDYSINSISAELILKSQNLRLSNANINRVNNHRVIHGWKQKLPFIFSLNHFSLIEIEDSRVKDLGFQLELFFNISIFRDNILESFRCDQINLEFEIPQSHWVEKILSKIGFLEYFLIEIPKGRKTIAKVWDLLEAAEVSFGQLDFIALFVKCREIGTLLDSKLKEELGSKSFSYKIRWGRSYDKFNYYSSYALHLEDFKKGDQSYSVEEIKVNKIDAEQLMLRTKSLIKYAEELMSENNGRN